MALSGFLEHVHSEAHSLDSLLGSIQQDIVRHCLVARERLKRLVVLVLLAFQFFLRLPVFHHVLSFLVNLSKLEFNEHTIKYKINRIYKLSYQVDLQDQFHLFQSV